MSIRIYKARDYKDMSRKAANILSAQVIMKPECVLGLGHNGHIGFNEPGEAFEKDVHCVQLTETTIQANKRFFASAEEVPKKAYTMGIKSIMQARKILVIVSGQDKAEIVKRAFFGPVTPQVPASILQMHNDVILVADQAALSAL